MTALSYVAPPTVAGFLKSQAFVRTILGPVGSGKSVGCVMALVMAAQAQVPQPDTGLRRSRFLVIRNTYGQLRDSTIKTWLEWFPDGAAGKFMSSTNTYHMRFGDVQSEIMFRALDGTEDIRNLLSVETSGAWLNECREIKPEVFSALAGRVGRFPPHKMEGCTRPMIVCDTNPPAVGSFWYRLFEGETEIEAPVDGVQLHEHFRQPSGMSAQAENVLNLPKGYYPKLLALNQHQSEEWVKVHVHGEYGTDATNTPVFPEFRRGVHVAARPLVANTSQSLALAFDFGLTPACLVGQQAPSGQWLLLKEYWRENCDLSTFLDSILPRMRYDFPGHDVRDAQVWADPAGNQRAQSDGKSCYEILRSRGMVVRPAPQDLETRLGSVRKVLTRAVGADPGLLVDPTCHLLIKGLEGGYVFARKKDGELNNDPKKDRHSHIADCMQYLLAAYEGATLRNRKARRFGSAAGFEKPHIISQSWSALV